MEMDRIDDEDEELTEEEDVPTQRFSVVIMWSEDSDGHIDQSELHTAIHDAVMELDHEAVVEVVEMNEPTY
jgi:hypothetical protein